MPTGLLWIFEAIYVSFGHATLTHLLSDLKSCLFLVSPRIRASSATGQAAMQAVLLIGPYDSEDMIVLEVLVSHRNATGAFSRTYHTTQTLRIFFTKAMLSPFEKQFLACYWDLVETEYLTMSHQVTMISSWTGYHQGQHCIIKGSSMYEIGLKQALESQVNFMR